MLQTEYSQLLDQFLSTAQGIAIFLITAAIVYVPGRYLVVPGVDRALDALEVDENIALPFEKVLSAAFALSAFFVATNVSGFAEFLSATEAITAAVTLAFGFAAQDVLGNLVSGVFIVVDPKFHIGDWIQWKDKEGIIEDISFRVTRVHTFDNELITVPNSELTKNAITNPVNKDRLRIRYQFGVSYEADIDEAREILLETAREHPAILDRPGPTVRVMELGESAIHLETRYWIGAPARTDFVRIRSEYVQAVTEAFDAAGIEMPFPTRALEGTIETRDAGPRADPPAGPHE